jgi:hypothetical protein
MAEGDNSGAGNAPAAIFDAQASQTSNAHGECASNGPPIQRFLLIASPSDPCGALQLSELY